MTWNAPGKQGGEDNNNDPWSGRRKPTSESTDVEQFLKKLQQKLNQWIPSSAGGAPENPVFLLGGLGFAVLFILWIFFGFFIVNPPEEAVVLRFGKYQETLGPGWHWIPRFIKSEATVNVDQLYNYAYDAHMLTKDENIVSVSVVVQYRVENARNYLYNVVNPEVSLQEATASALRQVVGLNSLDDILTTGREQIRAATKEQLNKILERYHAGIIVTDVNLQPAKAPEEVKAAFDDAIKAQEDEQRFVNQAQAYAMQVEPIAKGYAKRTLQEANAYKQQVILKSQGSTAAFNALLPQYKKAPDIMRQRMYMDTLQNILQHTTKVLVDMKSANNLLYFPLNEILSKVTPAETSSTVAPLTPSTTATPVATAVTPPTPPLNNTYETGGSY